MLFEREWHPKITRFHKKLLLMIVATSTTLSMLENPSVIIQSNVGGVFGDQTPIFTEEGVDMQALKKAEESLNPSKSFFRGISRTLKTEYDKTEELELPEYTKGFANVWDEIVETDQPIFWVVPSRKGSDTLVNIFSRCIRLIIAGVPVVEEIQIDEPLKVMSNEEDTARYVNVETTTVRGLKRAKEFDLAGSGLANIILTKHLSESSMLTDGESSRGRVFAVFSHPVRRIVHNYYEVTKDPESDYYDDEIAAMSLVEYAQSSKIVDNIITRSLVNDFTSANITSDQIDIAKDIIRRKFLVGILEWLESSIARIEKHFGWFEKAKNEPKVSSCHFHQIYKEASHLLLYPTPEWNYYISDILEERNKADLELYSYARHIFLRQRSLV